MLERELSRISQISSTGRRVENLAYLLNTDLLRQCFKELDPNKASGIFENVAYVMAFHADPTIPGTIDEWLDQFEMFSIYEVLPEILKLWGTNLITDAEAKKTSAYGEGHNYPTFPAPMSGGRTEPFRSRPLDDRYGPGHLD